VFAFHSSSCIAPGEAASTFSGTFTISGSGPGATGPLTIIRQRAIVACMTYVPTEGMVAPARDMAKESIAAEPLNCTPFYSANQFAAYGFQGRNRPQMWYIRSSWALARSKRSAKLMAFSACRCFSPTSFQACISTLTAGESGDALLT
jgi:hypothetical protein